MLSSGPVSDEVLFGAGGVVGAMAEGTTLVMMSSVPVETARRQADRAAEAGIFYVDAPVSGGEKGARDGTLAIMAGGAADVVAALTPIFETLGRPTHVGPAGAGSLAKLANQLIVASTICAVAEALLLAEQGGADAAKVREALLGGFADFDRSAPSWEAHDRRRFYSRRSGQISDQGHWRGSRARINARAQSARRHRGRPSFP